MSAISSAVYCLSAVSVSSRHKSLGPVLPCSYVSAAMEGQRLDSSNLVEDGTCALTFEIRCSYFAIFRLRENMRPCQNSARCRVSIREMKGKNETKEREIFEYLLTMDLHFTRSFAKKRYLNFRLCKL